MLKKLLHVLSAFLLVLMMVGCGTSTHETPPPIVITATLRPTESGPAAQPQPGPTQPLPTAAPTLDAPEPPEQSEAPADGQLRRSLLGIQGHFFIEEDDMEEMLDLVAYSLGFGWVKYQVDWSQVEYLDNQYSGKLDSLDVFIDQAQNRDLRVLLSVVKAPDWARPTAEEDGPPMDYNQYYEFLRMLVGRYGQKIHAVEVWNEPNLRREWNGGTISGGEYMRLLAGAYPAIKEVNAGVVVVSAGLAPTGVNDGVIAIDDRVYLRQMYEAGLPQYTDAIGIHPYGWANPPSARCCENPLGLPSHTENPHFYFLDTIEAYRAIQAQFGDSDRQLWATEFGWGTMDGLNLPVPEEQPFFGYLNQSQQADYILEAYRMGQSWDFMGPMFLWNLNVSALYGFDPNQAGYSILNSPEQPREAFRRLDELEKAD